MKLSSYYSRSACLCLGILAGFSLVAHAQTDYNYEVLYPYNGPPGTPIQVSDGNLYIAGGNQIARFSPPIPGFTTSSTTAIVHTASGNGGDTGSYTGVIEGTDGNLYGTSTSGGANRYGSVFKLTRTGVFSILYSFCSQDYCADGAGPNLIIQGTDGNFYGTTKTGGTTNFGTIFKLSPAGDFTPLYSFCTTGSCPDGAFPTSGLIQATDGNFYGVTSASGNMASSGAGIIYQLTPTGTVSTIFDLNTCSSSIPGDPCDLDVQSTTGPLTQGGDGKLYGLVSGLQGSQNGASFSIAFGVSTSGTFTPLATFCSDGDPSQCTGDDGVIVGGGSFLPIFPGSAHYLFLANALGGRGSGTGFGSFMIFYPGSSVNPVTYYDFCNPPDCGDGYNPTGAVMQANDGTFYGTINGGMYQITIVNGWYPPISITAQSTNLLVGQTAKLSWTVNNPTSDTLKQCIGWLDGNRIGPAPLSGSYDYTPATAGIHLVSLTCGGTETGLLRLFVANAKASTATALYVNPASAPTGTDNIRVVAIVTKQDGIPGSASGTVTIKADGVSLVTLPLNAYGNAVYYANTNGIAAGTYNLTATYNGDDADTASTSASSPFTVTANTSITSLAVNPNPVPANQPVQLIATVQPYSDPTDPAPSGFATFTYQNITLGKVAVAPIQNTGRSSATLALSDQGIPAGDYNVTVNYSGDAFYSPSSTFGTVTIQ